MCLTINNAEAPVSLRELNNKKVYNQAEISQNGSKPISNSAEPLWHSKHELVIKMYKTIMLLSIKTATSVSL